MEWMVVEEGRDATEEERRPPVNLTSKSVLPEMAGARDVTDMARALHLPLRIRACLLALGSL